MKCWFLRKDISRKQAKLILKDMQSILDRYGFVTVADFYDLVGSTPRYADIKKVWRSLKGARVSMMRKEGRYRMKLPDFEIMILTNKHHSITFRNRLRY